MNLNSNQTHSIFLLSKHDLLKLENFEIKYGFEGFDEGNNFLHIRNRFQIKIQGIQGLI
jgi:hypothetical protein